MSSDLLGAFGTTDITPSSNVKPQKANTIVDPYEDDDEDEDFGDFEDVQKEYDDIGVQDQGKDLLKLYDEAPAVPAAQVEEYKGWGQSSHIARDSGYPNPKEEWGDFAGQEEVIFDADQYSQKAKAAPQKLTKNQAYPLVDKFDFDDDDNWNPVDIPQNPIAPNQVTPRTTNEAAAGSAGNAIPKASIKTIKKSLGPPPSNIPPPSVLLCAITNHFQSLSAKIKDIVTLDRASSDPYEALDESRILALQKQVAGIRASARIIAGRKLRWKRDTILSQSMRIGPAGQGGMKLTSVDKNETRREDQEVSEAVHVWKKQIGALRSTIAKVNIHLPGEGLTIPDMAETIPVRQGKPSEGAVKGSKCCFLCGINRDERVARVDVWVEDSFGEWWVEFWGHVDCVDFWELIKRDLPQR